MATRKTVNDSLAPKKPATAASVRAAAKKAAIANVAAKPVEEVEEVLTYDDLSPELQAILDEANEIKEKEDAERRKRNATITSFILARYKIMKETGENADEAKAKFEIIAELEAKNTDELTLAEVADPMFDVIQALCGKHMATDFLKTVGGNKIAFVQIMKDVIRLANVVKA